MDEYDVSDIFKDMEEYLISSMSRNLSKHTAWEDIEGFKWDTWQSKQLEALAEFRKNNSEYVKGQTNDIKYRLSSLINQSNEHGQFEEEIKILNAIKNGYKGRKVEKGLESTFFKINDRKLKSLIKVTNGDLEKATTAALRMTNDQYKQTIYKAQVFANTGTMTVNQAIDMATKDFLSRGINCIEYSNGRRVGIDTYSEMAIRNANKKAYLQGEGVKRQEYGIVTVLVSRYGACSETCLPYQGKVYIDDVWSGGTAEDSERLGYPLLSTAIAGGLFHPNCKHTLTTYFEGLTTIPTAREVAKTRENSDLVATQRYNERNIRKYKRLENNSLDEENQAYYKQYRQKWQVRQNNLIASHPEMNRNRAREVVRVNDTFDKTNISFADQGGNSNLSSFKLDDIPEELVLPKDTQLKVNTIFDEMNELSIQTNTETMAIADLKSGSLLGGYSEPYKSTIARPTSEQMRIMDISDNDSLITMHNHPSNNPFSFRDIVTHNIIESAGLTIVETLDNYQYFISTPKSSRIRFENSNQENSFIRACEKILIRNKNKYVNLPISEVKHITIKEIAEQMGWLYGRKKR